MNILTKSQTALLNALDRYELKQASLSDLRRDTGLTVAGVRQVAYRLEERVMLALEGNKASITFAGQQALIEQRDIEALRHLGRPSQNRELA